VAATARGVRAVVLNHLSKVAIFLVCSRRYLSAMSTLGIQFEVKSG